MDCSPAWRRGRGLRCFVRVRQGSSGRRGRGLRCFVRVRQGSSGRRGRGLRCFGRCFGWGLALRCPLCRGRGWLSTLAPRRHGVRQADCPRGADPEPSRCHALHGPSGRRGGRPAEPPHAAALDGRASCTGGWHGRQGARGCARHGARLEGCCVREVCDGGRCRCVRWVSLDDGDDDFGVDVHDVLLQTRTPQRSHS
jgi:hypothetical protein